MLGTQVREVLYAGGRVTGVRVSARDGGDERTVTADHYVSALPVEHARLTWGRTCAPPTRSWRAATRWRRTG
ncbi:hypothetical protein GCM10020295_33630 [Streptomyces cinereospinus]